MYTYTYKKINNNNNDDDDDDDDNNNNPESIIQKIDKNQGDIATESLKQT